MNSNNLELSLIENEIEKISSKYHLKGSTLVSNIPPTQPQSKNLQGRPPIHQQENQAPYFPQQEPHYGQRQTSQSVCTFGENTVSTNSSGMGSQVLQDITLNKQGNIPSAKGPKINPKDLSNEELEYIIKTGKLPPKYSQPQPPIQNSHQQLQQQIQIQNQPRSTSQNQKQLQQQPSLNSYPISIQQSYQPPQQMDKTSSSHPLLQSYLVVGGQPSEKQYSSIDDRDIKNYNSPRLVSEYVLSQSEAQKQMGHLQRANQSSIMFDSSLVHDIKGSDPLQNSMMAGNLNTSTQSQAASQALKALQDRIKSLEKENQLLQDKLHLTESQHSETSQRQQSKLLQEAERAQIRETQLKEEIALVKRQLESVEQEKMRHLEENCSERDQWRNKLNIVEEQCSKYKQELQTELERFSGMSERIDDIKKRESFLRERYEKELNTQRERANQLEEELEKGKTRYDRLRDTLKEKNESLTAENLELKEELEKTIDRKDRKLAQVMRECDKYKREIGLLKEELAILGGPHTARGLTSSEAPKDFKKKNSMSSSTPKASYHREAAKTCKSPSQQFAKVEKQKLSSTGVEPTAISTIESNDPDSKKRKKERKARGKKVKADSGAPIETQLKAQIAQSSERKQSRHRKPSAQNMPLQKSHPASTQNTQKKRVDSTSKQRRRDEQVGIVAKFENLHKLNSARSDKSRSRSANRNGIQSASNLISINTKSGHVELSSDLSGFSGEATLDQDQKQYIYVDGKGPRRTLSVQKLNDSQATQSHSGSTRFNQFKRPSVDMNSSVGLSDYVPTQSQNNFLSSHHSIDHFGMDTQGVMSNFSHLKPLDIADFKPEKKVVENEIFYLEREIYDYNQQYKSLLTQQTSSNGSNLSNVSVSDLQQELNQKLRKIAQMLEEKSERLFDLKKQQQQILVKESLKGSAHETGIRNYQVRQEY